MKFSEEENVKELISDVIHNLRQRNEIIEDLTEEQAYSLFEEYGHFCRILLVMPKYLLRNKNFIINCIEKYDINALFYMDKSLLSDIEFVMSEMNRCKDIYNCLIAGYDILPKDIKYFIPIIRKSIQQGRYDFAINLINKIIENNDLQSYSGNLTKMKRNLKSMAKQSNNLVVKLINCHKLKKIINQLSVEDKNDIAKSENKELTGINL